MARPFVFRFHAAELFAQIQSMNIDEKAAFITQLSIDLLTLKPNSEYSKQLIDETLNLIEIKSKNGKKGGRPKSQAKAKVKLNESKEEAKPKQEEELKEKTTLYKEIIEDLNQKGGFSYRVSDGTIKLINGRISDGFTKEDFFQVHSTKIAKWKGTKWAEYLRPKTLYLPDNFQSYLNEAPPLKTKTIQNADGDFIQVPV